LVALHSWKTGTRAGMRSFPSKPIEPYLSSLESHVATKDVDMMKVVVDLGNGVAALTTPVLLRRIGCRVVTMNDNIDGRFPGRNSEPRPENLGPLASMVREEGAAFGVAHDGDGDRAIFVDESGVIHSGDMSLTLIEDEVLRKNRGMKVVTPVNTSMSVREVAEKRKGKLILTPVGSINVARTMIEERAILGGEENGGIFYAPHQPVRDGAMATVLVLNAIIENHISLSKLMGRLPRFFMHKEKRECKDERKTVAIGKIREILADKVTSTIDGVRVDLDHGWFLVRASGTEPLVRLYVEGETEKEMNRIRDEFNPLFDRIIGNP
ncbi:MAG TPA: phosphoglucosamine mutase, partial [Candidatus Bathyarchaeia archaeon]|nr:phosphoglucosamine mutase [Candidatus Bathyarchaeia archaeon]